MGRDLAMGQNLMGTFWEDYHLLKGLSGSWGVQRFDPLPFGDWVGSKRCHPWTFFWGRQNHCFWDEANLGVGQK